MNNKIINSVVGRNVVVNGNVVNGDLNITTRGNVVTINGVDVTMEGSAPIYITVEGDVKGDLSSQSGNVEIYGSVSGVVKTQSGDVNVKGDVGGISTMSGDVRATTVHGSVRTMSGDIITK